MAARERRSHRPVRTGSHGDGHLEALTLCDRRRGRLDRVLADALFVLIGGEPCTQWLAGTVQRRHGYILTGRDVARDRPDPPGWRPGRRVKFFTFP